jgi:thiol:disulfide interchange protein DsbA
MVRHLLLYAGVIAALHGYGVAAAENLPANGYLTLAIAQPQGAGSKVEVMEFFTYACPICFSYEPELSAWAERNRDRIVFKRVPVSLRRDWAPVQKMYFALELMGQAEVLHKKVFDAIHKEKLSIKSDEALGNLAEHLGLDRKQFKEVYFSAAVQAKIQRALQLQQDYQIDQVPMVSVDGRYLTSPATVAAMVGDDKPFNELEALSLRTLDSLLARSKKSRPAD